MCMDNKTWFFFVQGFEGHAKGLSSTSFGFREESGQIKACMQGIRQLACLFPLSGMFQ